MQTLKSISLLAIFALTAELSSAQITLIGDNAPHGVVADGDFNDKWVDFQSGIQPPYWKMRSANNDSTTSSTDAKMGLDFGRMFGSGKLVIAESKLLTESMQYQIPYEGDVLVWEFGADVEHMDGGTLSLSLVFGDVERMLAKQVEPIVSNGECEVFNGRYVLTAEDAAAGLPYIQVRFETKRSSKVWLEYINIYVERDDMIGGELSAEVTKEREIALNWKDARAVKGEPFNVYRAVIDKNRRAEYELITTTLETSYTDRNIVADRPYTYLVTRCATVKSSPESGRSNRVTISIEESDSKIKSMWKRFITTIFGK